jgi:hypothetical protein
VSRKWEISVSGDDAAKEVTSLFETEHVRSECLRILDLLASQADPQNPDSAFGLIVARLERDAPKWYRIKVPRFAIRIVFRLVVIRNNQPIEISRAELARDQDEKYIDIIQDAYRSQAYGKALRERYRQMRSEED